MIGRIKGSRGRRAGRELESLAEPILPHWIIVAKYGAIWRVTLGMASYGDFPSEEAAVSKARSLFAARHSNTILITRNIRTAVHVIRIR